LEILRRGLYNREELESPFLKVEEKIELLNRIMVRSRFMEVLSGKLEPPFLKALENVFFEIVYPTPTQDMKM